MPHDLPTTSAGRKAVANGLGHAKPWVASCVHECFERLADRQPEAPAVVTDEGVLTYADLERRANALAHALLGLDVRPEEPVGVLTDRSASLPLAFLALLKAGAVYVPMVADLPPQRLANMAGQSGMRFVIVLDGLIPPAELLDALAANAVSGALHGVLRPEELPEDALARRPGLADRSAETTGLAAILFTSGSTGQPKGVLIQHDACINMGHGHIDAHRITPDDRILLSTSPGFILGFRELCLPLMAGAAYVPVSRALLDDPSGLLATMSRHRVSIALFTPSYLRLLNGAVPDGLRCILTAGERPNPEDARHYARRLDYWNMHGATEVCGTICMLQVDPDGEGTLPSGRPFTNMAVHLLDADGNEVPPGEIGEIHVVGIGVSRGYLNQPELTAGSFVETRFGRAYRSHDLARWNEHGLLESLGRANDVVKVSGQSVELGEIERTLLTHPDVTRAAAAQHKGRLVAFVESPRPEQARQEDWHGFLVKTLARYMIPAQVIVIAKMLISSAGKVDRQGLLALADAEWLNRGAGNGGTPPQGELEQRIAQVWEDLLDVRPIMRDDNFFALGGTSLLAIQLSQRLQGIGYPATVQEILGALTVEALARTLEQAAGEPGIAESADSDSAENTATAGQEDFWIAAKLGFAPAGSHVARVLSVRGPVPETAVWRDAWTRLIARHAALRTAFFADAEGTIRWRTVDGIVDDSALTPDAGLLLDHCRTAADARDIVARHTNRPFTLTEAPLARAGLIRVDEGEGAEAGESAGETLFWFVLHHAVVDGVSASIVQTELLALLLDRPLPPAAHGIQLAGRAERRHLRSPLAGRDHDYWRDTLDALLTDGRGEAFDEYATDHHRPATPSEQSAPPLAARLNAATVGALTRIAQAHRIGLHGLLLTLLAAEIRRRNGRADVIVGSGVSVRPAGAETAIGHFVNLLPLALRGGGENGDGGPLAAQFSTTQATLTGAVAHAGYPAGLILREFRRRHPDARPLSRTSLFDIALTANPSRSCTDDAAGLSLVLRRLPGDLTHPAAGVDLAFSHEPVGEDGDLELALQWNPDVYQRSTAEAWLASFAAWARWLAEDPARADLALPALLPFETALLERLEHGPAVSRPALRSHEIFEEIADRHPDRPAVVTSNGTLTLGELDAHANRVAASLLRHGVGREEAVAVLTECSPDLPATVLGIWKAGAAYLPLARELPAERLAFMMRDAGVRVLIVLDDVAVPDALAQSVATTVRPETLASEGSACRPNIAGTPTDLAYIIYTSGTTGLPKGVALQHDGLVNAVLATGETISLSQADRIALCAMPGFDASVHELGLGMLHGMAIVPVSQALRDDPWALKRFYRDVGVTWAFQAPSYLRISQETPFEGLRVLLAGGESLNHDDAAHHADKLAFWNGYGPTEATILVSLSRVAADADRQAPIPAGHPLSNLRISIRSANGDPMPPGVAGEVWLGGLGLARGYLNNPDLTARSFVETAEGRFYRTGDLGRWTSGGQLEIGGRIDHQVKIHGQRVELGEIEQAMLGHPAVRQAVVLVDKAANDTKFLRAFIRLSDAADAPDAEAWRVWLADRLPTHMVPATVTPVAAVPLTAAGKVDREALLKVASTQVTDADTAKQAPQGELEIRIATLWGELFGCSIAREDNFFALGGNSLLAVTMAHRLSTDLGFAVPARVLFAAPTLAGFARHMAGLSHTAADGGSIHAADDDLATEGEREFWTAEAAGFDTRAFTIPVILSVEGEMPPLERWNAAWRALVTRHAALRTRFEEDGQGQLRRRTVSNPYQNLETASAADRASALECIRDRQNEPFAMGAAPLWRIGLVAVEDIGEHLFWLALHHAVGDGRSAGILITELKALLLGEALPPPAANFSDITVREQRYLAGEECAGDARHWRDTLAALPASAFEDWPLDTPRSASTEPGRHRLHTRLNPATAESLWALARRHETSPHAVMLALLSLEVRRRTGRADFVLGTAASTRETAGEAEVVGYGVNMLPLPFHLDGDTSFGTLLRETQRTLAAALLHARYPFARIYHDFRSEHPGHRHPTRYPLFDMAVTENPASRQGPAPFRLARPAPLPDSDGHGHDYERTAGSPGQDMVLIHEALPDGGMLLELHVNAALFGRETAHAWFGSLAGWAGWLAEDPARADSPPPALLPFEIALLERLEQGPEIARPALRCHEFFEDLATRHPDLPAVVTGGGMLSRAGLDAHADRIAASLLRHGVGREEAVAVLTGCSATLPATVLGIWKAGAAYLPLAHGLPADRLAFMARDAGVRTLVALDGFEVPAALAQAVEAVIRPEEILAANQPAAAMHPRVAGTPQDLACIIYTSGTTGLPKGVALQHDGLVNAVLATGEAIGIVPEDRIALVTTPAFDAALWELGSALLHGLGIVPVSQALRDDPWELKRFYRDNGVTVAFHAPSYLRISQETPFEGLRILLTGGEAPNHDDAAHHADKLAFWNGYGPTEATILVSLSRIAADADRRSPIPAGRPLPNTRISIRHDNGDPVPPGVSGEVWLGGSGLGRGYLNNADLTARSFVETAEGRFYRTGDLGRWTSGGQLEIGGRIDHQVKIHGQRVELGEIEQAVLAHPAVRQAVVLVDKAANGTAVLRAFVRLADGHAEIDNDACRALLTDRLPAHMVPATVTPVPAIPLTAAGKIDRAALLKAALTLGVDHAADAAKAPPQGELEIRIAVLWNELLGCSAAREDNFFALGGNSLLAVTMVHRLSAELGFPVPARTLFAASTLAGFARQVAELSRTTADDGTVYAADGDLATEGEREFWTAEAAGLDTRTFTIPVVQSVEGKMPPLERWNSAWQALVMRHAALRTRFEEDGQGQLRRLTVPSLDQDLETATSADRESAMAHIRDRQGEAFALGAAPLWRAGLVTVPGTGEHLFWLALHHAVGDGRSVGILITELTALLLGETLPPPAAVFGDIAARERRYLAGKACVEDARHWRDTLAALPATAFDDWSLDTPRSVSAVPGCHRLHARLDAGTAQALRALARQHSASLHAVILTLLSLEVRRRTGRADFVLGTTAATRETATDAEVVGYGVNMLPLAFRLDGETSFGALLRETQRTLAAALLHARYPFARIYHDFWNEHPGNRHPSRYPLFDIAVTENPAGRQGPAPFRLVRPAPRPNGDADGYEYTGTSPGQDMVLIHEDQSDGGLLLLWQVNAALYGQEMARSWFESLTGWAEWLAADGARADDKPPALLPFEAERLAPWEHGPATARPRLRFHELFESVLDRPGGGQADHPAVMTSTATLTYGEVEREANAIAHALLARDLKRQAVVGVLTGRSANLPMALLGVWKAGAVYLPLAADLPPERLAFMARDAGVAQLIALDGLPVPDALARDLPPALRPEAMAPEFRRDHAGRPNVPGDAGDIAYILYTSGSTGKPKGTLVGHAGYVNTVLSAGETFGLTRDDRTLMVASPSFDVSLSDIGVPLAFGATLCPVPDDVLRQPSQFLALLTELRVTVADVTPTYLRLFGGADLPTLRILVTGGEAPFPADIRRYAGTLRYYNAYGPTENTITSTVGRLGPEDRGFLSCGRPLPNTSVAIRDNAGNPVPPGVMGEIWLGGVGLAHGYLNRQDLTAASFVQTPEGRRYRTGDLGRWRAGGELEVAGRIDDQVKLNGIRIELGEIEHALETHPGVAQAVVLIDGEAGGTQRLWAFVSPTPSPAPEADPLPKDGWRDHLAGHLPTYMIPAAVIPVPAIPLTPSGKVDKPALKALQADRPRRTDHQHPLDATQSAIAHVWEQVLRCGPVHRDDDFFMLGGHSLLAIAVAHRLETEFGHPVPARELFAEPTLAGFARRVGEIGAMGRPAEMAAEASSDRATEGEREFHVAEQAGLDTRGFHIALTLDVLGAVPSDDRWLTAWAALATRHDALRTRFQEDDSGVLRRIAPAEGVGTFQIGTTPDRAAALHDIRARQSEPFAMDAPPLWRAGLTRVDGTDETLFWLVLHHSIGDGLSLGVLVEELTAILHGGVPPALEGSPARSAALAEAYLDSEACRDDAAHWRGVLAGMPEAFDEWPLDFPRPAGRSAKSAKGTHTHRIRLDAATADALRRFAQRNGASLHALMLTILAQEAHRRAGRTEFLLGTAASTRETAAEARVVGYYVNMLPVPCRLRRGQSVEQALAATQRALGDGLRRSRYPFARIYQDLRRDHPAAIHPGRYPLFDLAVTENPAAGDGVSAAFRFAAVETLTGEGIHYDLRPSGPAQDMVLVHEGQPDGSLVLQWHVNASLYERETAGAWLDSLAGTVRLLADPARQPGTPLPALLPDEETLLAAWEHGPALPHPAPCLHDLFGQLAASHPDRPALVTEAGVRTYAQVNARANAIAHALLGLGVKQGEPVGVFTERSAALPETALAIWKAGGCYLPLTRDLPADRLAFIARDAGIGVIVVLDGHVPPPALADAGYRILTPETLPESFLADHAHAPYAEGESCGPSGLAYILYTSGSTGVPKGVMLRHQGMMNLGVSASTRFDVVPEDRALLMSSPSFDLWISDLVMVWTAGAALVPVTRTEMDDIPAMHAKLARLGVTMATMPPSYLRLFEGAEFPGLRFLMTVGEPPNPADAERYASQLAYWNGYGPTENTAAASFGRVTPGAARLTAGRPLPNTSIHILNEDSEPVPPLATGHVWLGGMGLAVGYLNRSDLTEAAFVETPAGRRYRTGDLGRWTGAGELLVLGRSDNQVKLRGQRVELGEIEHLAGTQPGVRQAVALVDTQTDGTQSLWAFAAMQPDTDPPATEPTQAEWRSLLAAKLPAYMIPAAVIRVPVIPTTMAGKVDRTALLQALADHLSQHGGAGLEQDATGARTPPRGPVESRIAEIWQEQLQRPSVCREDSFFELGGDSLRAIAVVNRVRREFECRINDLYENPMLADFAKLCKPQPGHLDSLVRSTAAHWLEYRRDLATYEAAREASIGEAQRRYDERNQAYADRDFSAQRDYRRVLLTGASGYLGAYLLRDLMADPAREVTVIVRGADDGVARTRLEKVLHGYFGPDGGAALAGSPRLTILAGDLRRDRLGLSSRDHDRLAKETQAVLHCAANVNHFGHYRDSHADNVIATRRLLELAARPGGDPADFHFVSTLSVSGKAPEEGFQLFTEYDAVPDLLEENYYVRSKQEAERLVIAARGDLANACIHRVGNVVFAADGGPLQLNIRENAFFRLLGAVTRLGVIPDDSHVWLCHVDAAARVITSLAGATCLVNETHHVEHWRRDTLADFITTAQGIGDGVRSGDFGAFLDRLRAAIDEPAMDAALSASLEAFGIYRGVSPQSRSRRMEITSERTRSFLDRLGVSWPDIPAEGQAAMVTAAARLFA